MKTQHCAIRGKWTSGVNKGLFGVISDVRVGKIYTVAPDGTRAIGSPDEFRAETGETADHLMSMALPWPHQAALFRGAVREALAEARSIATVGIQDTRIWDQPYRYIVDDNQGNVAS